MEKLLILGASSAQAPFVEQAKKMGCYIGIIDHNDQAPTIKLADEYFCCSLFDVEEVINIVEKFKPTGITCGTCDVGVITASKICEKFGLPGLSIETALKFKDKGIMIEAFKESGIAHAEYQIITSLDDKINLSFPVITKPVHNSASRGISIARNKEQLKSALSYSFSYSDVKRVIVEEYMIGPEVSVEILVQDGEPYIIQVTDKMTTGEPFFIEIGHSQPSQLSEADIIDIKELAYNTVKALGMKDGCCHAEIKLTSKGPKMVEIAGRLGGDFITTILTPISTGINMAEYEILRALGKPKKILFPTQINKSVAIMFIGTQAGRLESVDIDSAIKNLDGIENISVNYKTGCVYKAQTSNADRLGYVIATGKTAELAVKTCEKALDCIKLNFK